MKNCLLVLLCALCALSSRAYTERNLITSQATRQQLETILVPDQKWVPYPAYTDRAGWDALLGDSKAEFIARGERLLDYAWPRVNATAYLEFERSGNRKIMESVLEDNNNNMCALIMAELAEGKGRFIDQLINGVYSAAEMTTWSLSAHTVRQPSHRSIQAYDFPVIDLVAGDMGSLYSWTYYFFKDAFDQVDPEISRRLRHELNVRILDQFLKDDGLWWDGRNYNGRMLNNWTPWCESNVLMTAMLIENDMKRYADIVYLTMDGVDKFLNYIKGDGACEEGPSYWGHAAGKLLDYVNMISMATTGKIDVSNSQLIRDMGEYISRSYVGDGWVVNFADASARGDSDPYLVYRFAKTVNSDELKGFAALMNSRKAKKSLLMGGRDIFRQLAALEIARDLQAAEPVHNHAANTWYPETEFYYATTPKGLFFAAKGGFNDESHNHNDAGTFSLWANNFPLIIDAGVGTYTRQTFSSERYTIWTMQSGWHNLPQINGVDQKYGRKYKATDVKAAKNRFQLNIAGAYPETARVKSWVRTYDVKDREVNITDNFQLEAIEAPTVVNFLSWGSIDTSVRGKVYIEVQGHKAVITYDASRFSVSTTDKALDDPRLSNVWGPKITRISLTDKHPGLKGTYRFSVKAL